MNSHTALPRRVALAAAASGLAAALLTVPSAAAMADTAKPTIVLVHGGFADASNWNGVIKPSATCAKCSGW
ncbi:hypothetical protein [Nonomuraea sediminis]|uniref:hypothetical protein n=1 Tax=Nonomuraea sediminis TaxID=2835864 RepID=UPI001BDD5CA7|nr:hypothetical protein [Nonomuraea sediminis]